MASEIIMPKLSDTMTEGQLGAWRKAVGDRIERGDIIAEVETDKATMDLEAFAAGILLEQRVKAGELVPVGTVIGLIGEAKEATAPQPHIAAAPPLQPAPAAPATYTEPAATKAAPAPFPTPVAGSGAHGVQAAPVVRHRAAELGIELAGLHGSGPEGRIMLEDLERPAPAAARAAPVAGEPSSPVAAAGTQLSRMRSAIARTTSSSWQTIPHFYLSRDMEMGRTEQLIRELKTEKVSVSLNALIMAATAQALLRFPALNAGFGKEGIVSYPQVNLAFAVALNDGLQVPVIGAAETKSVRELTAATAILTEKARQGSLTPDEISGGSFTVSNLGMYGVDAMASIIMPGQAGILALGAVADRPAVHDGQLAVARIMTATLSCDHRIIDGAVAAGFLNEVKRLLENPAELSA